MIWFPDFVNDQQLCWWRVQFIIEYGHRNQLKYARKQDIANVNSNKSNSLIEYTLNWCRYIWKNGWQSDSIFVLIGIQKWIYHIHEPNVGCFHLKYSKIWEKVTINLQHIKSILLLLLLPVEIVSNEYFLGKGVWDSNLHINNGYVHGYTFNQRVVTLTHHQRSNRIWIGFEF